MSEVVTNFYSSKSLGSGLELPYNLDAERFVLGGMLLDMSLFQKYADILKEEDFYLPVHRDIFFSMKALFSDSGHINFIFLEELLLKKGLEKKFVSSILNDLCHNIEAIGLVSLYVPLIKEKSNLRKIISSCSEIISQCYDKKNDNSVAILESAERLFFDILSRNQISHYQTLDNSVKQVFTHIVSSQSSERGLAGIPSGFSSLDYLTCGFQAGDFIILAARPSMGKTALALCIARNVVAKGNPVAFISLEMASDQLAMRILSFDASVPLASLRSGSITTEEWEALTSSVARISDYTIYIDDNPGQSLFEIKTRARQVALQYGIKLFIIDYLQLIYMDKKFESRHYEVSEISRSLKGMAKELSVPVIALSQLSRGVESRTDKRPLLSDLRDSGAIEQDADLILFLYRDIVYNKETLFPDLAELIIGKHRNGPTGVVSLRYVKEYTFFEEYVV